MLPTSRTRFLNWPWAAAVAACLSAGCASTPPVQDQGPQLRAILERQDALERKVAHLEAQLEVVSRRPAPVAAPARQVVVEPAPEEPAVAPAPSFALPSHLRTVRLAPTTPKPPALATAVELREPAPELVDELLSPAEEEPVEGPSPLEGALSLLRTGEVERGVRVIDEFVDKNPRHADAPEALFIAGMAMQNYREPALAAFYYQRVADDYPLSRQAPDAMLRMGACQLQLKKVAVAREVFARVMQRYPGTPAAKAAESELKELERQAAATAKADAEADAAGRN